MKRDLECAAGASSDDRKAFLTACLEKKMMKELVNYRGTTGYRIFCTYPAANEFNVVALWNLIFSKTDFPVCIIADESAILKDLNKIDESNHPRLTVGMKIPTTSRGLWDVNALTILSELQARRVKAFPMFIPKTPPKEWGASLQQCIGPFDLTRCELICADTASLVLPRKEGLASQSELDETKDQLAQKFFSALKGIAGSLKLHFQHHAARRFQVAWERRILSPTVSDSFGLLLKCLDGTEIRDENALKELHEKVIRADASKIESFAAMYEIHELLVATEGEDSKEGKRRFKKICQVVWNRKRSQINRYLEAGKFVHLLKKENKNHPLPECEYHIRSICELPEKHRVSCWLEIHDEISRFPDDKESVLKRVERYAQRNRIALAFRVNSRPAKSTKEKLLNQLKETAEAVTRQFGSDSEISRLSGQLLSALTVQSAAKEAPSSEQDCRPEEPSASMQALSTVASAEQQDSFEPNPSSTARRLSVPIGTVPHSADPVQSVKEEPPIQEHVDNSKTSAVTEAFEEMFQDSEGLGLMEENSPWEALPSNLKNDPSALKEGPDATG